MLSELRKVMQGKMKRNRNNNSKYDKLEFGSNNDSNKNNNNYHHKKKRR